MIPCAPKSFTLCAISVSRFSCVKNLEVRIRLARSMKKESQESFIFPKSNISSQTILQFPCFSIWVRRLFLYRGTIPSQRTRGILPVSDVSASVSLFKNPCKRFSVCVFICAGGSHDYLSCLFYYRLKYPAQQGAGVIIKATVPDLICNSRCVWINMIEPAKLFKKATAQNISGANPKAFPGQFIQYICFVAHMLPRKFCSGCNILYHKSFILPIHLHCIRSSAIRVFALTVHPGPHSIK